VYRLEFEFFVVALGGFAFSVFPGRDMAEVLVVPLGLVLISLVLFTEVTPAGFFALQSIAYHQLAELHEVCNAACVLEVLIEGLIIPQDSNVMPEGLAQGADGGDGFLEASAISGHAALIPADEAQFSVE
jgi:hypothetical protein